MRQITKDLLITAILADPSNNDMVERLEIQCRHGGDFGVASVRRIKGGLDIADADIEGRIHMIDEENIVGIGLQLTDAAYVAGINTVAQLVEHATRNLKMKATL